VPIVPMRSCMRCGRRFPADRTALCARCYYDLGVEVAAALDSGLPAGDDDDAPPATGPPRRAIRVREEP
jgi:hypothetical protein